MAIGLDYLQYLDDSGILDKEDLCLLDVGTQNLLGATEEDVYNFVRNHGTDISDENLRIKSKELADSSIISPGITTTYLGELIDLTTSIKYESIDIFDGHNTTILDLNFEPLPEEWRDYFDVVLNFGTTEHIFNQYNCFKVIHEATKSGGYMFHQIPSIGYLDHGYYMYSPRLFTELCTANDYELCDLWFTGPQGMMRLFSVVDYADSAKDDSKPGNSVDIWREQDIPNSVLNVLLKKNSLKKSTDFRISVDTTTTAGMVSKRTLSRYSEPKVTDMLHRLKHLIRGKDSNR